MVGKTLGHYEILEPLGKGGMGEVYRARDTKLDRDVAIKVLPEDFATDPDRLARLRREAKLLAALNHPNIATVHALEGEEGASFLVLELVTGESLERKLAKGPLPVEKALDICKQIAEALEAAHGAGIIHRDLKPANVLVTPDGRAKVLDFGIAKSMQVDAEVAATAQATNLTVAGTLVGTPSYMSPEQVRGGVIDKRVDIWAFGCLLFETLTAKSAFAKETMADTLAAIVDQEPDWNALPNEIPPQVRRLIGRCLRKDPARRLHDIADARIEIEDSLGGGTDAVSAMLGSPAAVETARGIPWKLAVPLAVATLLIGALGTWWAMRPAAPDPEPPMRFEIELPEGVNFSNVGRRIVAISPDGSRIVFVADGQLWMRLIGDLVPTRISGTENARSPFFSPDGQQVGFQVVGTNELKRVAVTGGAPVLIGTIGPILGASWADNDMIYYGQRFDGIWQVPGTGGTPEVVIEMEPDEGAHGPQLLPGGEWLLFTLGFRGSTWSQASIVAQSLVTEQRVVLIQGGTEGRWVPTGHLVYVQDRTLFAVAFDPGAMEPPSGPVSMVEGIRMAVTVASGAANYGFTSDGGLVYVPGTVAPSDRLLVWVDRSGRAEPVSERRGEFQAARLSPDGHRVAVEVNDQRTGNVWILGIEDDSFAPLNNEGVSMGPLWTPDGSRVLYHWAAEDAPGATAFGGIYSRAADFSSEREEILQTDGGTFPISWSGDGEDLVLHEVIDGVQGQRRIQVVPFVGEDRTAFAPLDPSGQFNQRSPMVSPDGHWVAYVSTQSGRDEVYVRPFPDGGTRVQISNNGGVEPMWGTDSSELFYREMAGGGTSRMIAAQLSSDPVPSVTDRTELFSGTYYYMVNWARTMYDYDRANDRFLMVDTSGQVGDETNSPTINVILNWFEELKQRVPTGR